MFLKYQIFLYLIINLNDIQLKDSKPYDFFDNSTKYNNYLLKLDAAYKSFSNDNYNYSKIENNNNILINPCINNNLLYCRNKQFNFNENLKIIANNDLFIIFKTNTKIYTCNKFFQIKINCGSFLEIHKPFNSTILYSQQINYNLKENENNEIFLKIDNLCAGKYEIWYVIRTRSQKIIIKIKPFFIIYPNCIF